MGKRLQFDTDAKIEAKIKAVEDIFILSPRHQEVLKQIDKCRRRSKLSKEPFCILLLGLQGVGKTTTYEYYEHQWPRIETPKGTKVRVLSVQIEAPATVKSLVTEMLRVLGDPASDRGSIVSQTQRLRKMLKECGVELIIMDEFQHFRDRGSQKVLETISDWLKVLINKTKIPVVLCGMPYSKDVLDVPGNEQLRDRFSARIYLEPYHWGPTTEERRDFRTFLAQVDKALPLRDFNLGSVEMAFRLFCATSGFPRKLMNLIRGAAIMAIEMGNDNLDMDLFAKAYDERYAAEYPDRKNPFTQDFGDLEIPIAKSEPERRDFGKIISKERASDVLRVR